MQRTRTPLLNRSDTFFGVCEGLGQDSGVNPDLFRLAFAGLLFWNPMLCFATYFGLGVVVYTLRWIMPDHIADEVSATSVIDERERTAENDEYRELEAA